MCNRASQPPESRLGLVSKPYQTKPNQTIPNHTIPYHIHGQTLFNRRYAHAASLEDLKVGVSQLIDLISHSCTMAPAAVASRSELSSALLLLTAIFAGLMASASAIPNDQ